MVATFVVDGVVCSIVVVWSTGVGDEVEVGCVTCVGGCGVRGLVGKCDGVRSWLCSRWGTCW